VETPEQLLYLRRNGCDEGQGYFFSKPLPADEAAQWLKKTRFGMVDLSKQSSYRLGTDGA
jgi:sensor c-di-GMP phosphodiesterase-like protein